MNQTRRRFIAGLAALPFICKTTKTAPQSEPRTVTSKKGHDMKLDEWLAQSDIDIRKPLSTDTMPRTGQVTLFFAWQDIGDGKCKSFVAAFRFGDVDFPVVPDNLIPGHCRMQLAFSPLDYDPPKGYRQEWN